MLYGVVLYSEHEESFPFELNKVPARKDALAVYGKLILGIYGRIACGRRNFLNEVFADGKAGKYGISCGRGNRGLNGIGAAHSIQAKLRSRKAHAVFVLLAYCNALLMGHVLRSQLQRLIVTAGVNAEGYIAQHHIAIRRIGLPQQIAAGRQAEYFNAVFGNFNFCHAASGRVSVRPIAAAQGNRLLLPAVKAIKAESGAGK